jgi:hypothetical protein
MNGILFSLNPNTSIMGFFGALGNWGNENEALVDLIRAFLKTEILDKEGNSYTCREKGIACVMNGLSNLF